MQYMGQQMQANPDMDMNWLNEADLTNFPGLSLGQGDGTGNSGGLQ